MTEQTFTPAMGRFGSGRLFDLVAMATRERLWRPLIVMYAAPRAGDRIVDVGCGTGSLAVLLNRVAPDADVIGVDPDPAMLAVAAGKNGSIDWREGMGDQLVELLGPESVDTVVSSLVLHQCPMPVKQAILASMFAALRSGGRLVIGDYGLQRNPLMRNGFRIVQFVDGKEDTQPNADGVLPDLITAAGFARVREAEVISTVSGSISIYVAEKD